MQSTRCSPNLGTQERGRGGGGVRERLEGRIPFVRPDSTVRSVSQAGPVPTPFPLAQNSAWKILDIISRCQSAYRPKAARPSPPKEWAPTRSCTSDSTTMLYVDTCFSRRADRRGQGGAEKTCRTGQTARGPAGKGVGGRELTAGCPLRWPSYGSILYGDVPWRRGRGRPRRSPGHPCRTCEAGTGRPCLYVGRSKEGGRGMVRPGDTGSGRRCADTGEEVFYAWT